MTPHSAPTAPRDPPCHPHHLLARQSRTGLSQSQVQGKLFLQGCCILSTQPTRAPALTTTAPAPGQPATDPTLLNNALGSAQCCKERVKNISALLQVTLGSRLREELPPAKGSEKAESMHVLASASRDPRVPPQTCGQGWAGGTPRAGLGASPGSGSAAPLSGTADSAPCRLGAARGPVPTTTHLLPTALPVTPSSPQPRKCKFQIPPKNPNQMLPSSQGDDGLGEAQQRQDNISPPLTQGEDRNLGSKTNCFSTGKVFIQVKMFLR